EITDKILLSKDNLFCNKPDPDEGKYIEYLVDGNYTNFFHTDWHDAGTVPHYIDITLPSPVEQFKIQTYYRNGKYGQCPVEITVLGSNDGEQWNKIAEIEDDGKGGASYTTPTLGTEGQPYSYIRYRADETSGNAVYFALAELEFYTVRTEIYDPEGIYRPEDKE
ncbi:MAG: discoidin domain-containing protein, partial [Bacteroides caccae]|nr:discoidin domain-containing protein [Bacteroides caccae]